MSRPRCDEPGARPVFGQLDPLVYLSLADARGVAWFLRADAAGLIIRAVGEKARRRRMRSAIRCRRALCRGAVRRRDGGLAGATVRWCYTPMWAEEHDGRARLDRAGAGGLLGLAAVAAAARRLSLRRRDDRRSSKPGARPRHGRAAVLLSMLPYLATIVVLVLISTTRRRPARCARGAGQAVRAPAGWTMNEPNMETTGHDADHW